MSLKKFIAFTLAEVLIVLAIIGVAAALTLPTLNDDVEDKKVVAKLRKIAPELDGIYQSIVQTYGKPYEWSVPSGQTPASMMQGYFEEMGGITKSCGTGTGCFKGTIDSNTNFRKFLMKDGSSVGIYILPSDDLAKVDPQDDENYCRGQVGYFLVDVNGIKGENSYGNDVFQFEICSDGVKPGGEKGHFIDTGDEAEYNTAWVIDAGNRDYLYCNDLSWNSKRTCK